MRKDYIHGMFRAVVVDNNDKEEYGRVLVWIPDLMPTVDRTKGIWARPANNPVGGRNTEGDPSNHFVGTSYIPRNGSWVFIFFEGGNINRPYYFGALDLENTQTLPETRVGKNPHDKWVIIKSHDGRAIVVSDDPDDARVEITGKKREMENPPSGNIGSVYTIDENMTTILFDERSGKEKILIRTYKGDFIHIDVDEQNLQAFFQNDITIKCGNNFKLTAAGDIDIKSEAGDIKVQSESGAINLKTSTDFKQDAGGSSTSKSQNDSFTEAGGNINHKASGNINNDATIINDQGGAATGASEAATATSADPKGERDT